MRLGHKVAALFTCGSLWVGVVSAQSADLPGAKLWAANLANSKGSASQQVVDPASATNRIAATSSAQVAAASQNDDIQIGAPTSTPAPAPLIRSTNSGRTTLTQPSPKPAGYSAGGSLSSSSQASQLYAQTTQTGWGCQAALQYLAQHANPQFSLVCPGNAMGHQAMTCMHQPGVCADVAEIVIADPCPAAYENEAWNSWHMDTGPFDPYGWCSDWNNHHAPSEPAPLFTTGSSQSGFVLFGG